MENPVIVLVHGIRTAARWQSRVAALIVDHMDCTVLPIKYGYFDLLRFLAPVHLLRSYPINYVEKQLRSVIRDYPKRPIVIFAHSFGTYTVTKVLSENPDIAIDRLILCGSVVPNDFDWARVSKQVRVSESRLGILNECGTKDVWPVLAQSLTWGYGATGTFGFGSVHVTDRFHQLKHSEFFKTQFVNENWIPYLDRSALGFSETDRQGNTSSLAVNILRFPIKYLLVLLILFSLVGTLGKFPRWQSSEIDTQLESIAREINSEQYLTAKAYLASLEGLLLDAEKPIREKTVTWLASRIALVGREVDYDQADKRSLNYEILRVIKRFGSNPFREYFAEMELSGVDLAGMDFSGLHIYTLSFADSFLVNAYFDHAQLENLSFNNSSLRYTTFSGASFSNVDFTNADWFNAIGIDFGEFSSLELKEMAACPKNLEEFRSFHDDIYYVKFDELGDEFKADISRNWAEILEDGAICDRISAS